jgi:hypothetical protein
MPSGPGASVLFPLPRVELPHRTSSRSRRVQSRSSHTTAVTDICNDMVDGLNSLYFNHRPPSFSSAQQQHSVSPTYAQQRALANIYRCARRFHTRRHSAATHVVESCDESLASFYQSLTNYDLLSSSYSSPVATVPLVADRVALPTAAGAVDLLDALPSDVADMYRQPSPACLRPPDECASRVKPRLYAAPGEYAKLVLRLRASGMVSFTTAPQVVNGVFGVLKPDGMIRLIVDGRPANAVFVEPPRVSLPTPDVLPKLMAPPDRPLFVAKCDLSDFFYRFRIPQWMQPWFALPAVRAGDVGLTEFAADAMVYPCLTVLAMGWSHSVFLAQQAHEHLLDTRTRLLRCDRITHTSDLRIDRVRHLVYIDDLILFGTDPVLMRVLLGEYVAVTADVGLPAKPSKVVQPTADGVDCLGIELVGRDRTLAPRADKLQRLRMDTMAMLARGCCTGNELAVLVGRWTWLCLVTRPALSCFAAVYRFMKASGRRLFALWHSVANELLLVARLSPLFVASLASDWFPAAIATDASSWGQGVVVANAPAPLLEVAARDAGAASLVSPKPAAAITIDEQVLARPWYAIVSSPWREPEHINSLELRAISTAIRHVVSRAAPFPIRRRLLLLSDSQVAIGALSKGRSSSHTLLCRLRPISALLLASGISLFCRWIGTAANPADAASRAPSALRTF